MYKKPKQKKLDPMDAAAFLAGLNAAALALIPSAVCIYIALSARK